MKKRILALLCFGTILQFSACNPLTDIAGWDLHSCIGSGWDTCWDLFSDNEEKILGGQTLIDVIFGEL